MSSASVMQERAEQFRKAYAQVEAEIGIVIVGHSEIVHGVLTCLFVGGHALLEGVPGLGKTLLVRTLSQVLDLQFNRIQFTPDLMPSDIIGTNIIMEAPDGKRVFSFQPGPLFAQIVLADEINRATPKTQSALLEAMQEHSVTVGGTIHRLKEPFFVMATQNPIEQEGTYPLPEAQLDRFLFQITIEYPSLVEERRIEVADRKAVEKAYSGKGRRGRVVGNLEMAVEHAGNGGHPVLGVDDLVEIGKTVQLSSVIVDLCHRRSHSVDAVVGAEKISGAVIIVAGGRATPLGAGMQCLIAAAIHRGEAAGGEKPALCLNVDDARGGQTVLRRQGAGDQVEGIGEAGAEALAEIAQSDRQGDAVNPELDRLHLIADVDPTGRLGVLADARRL